MSRMPLSRPTLAVVLSALLAPVFTDPAHAQATLRRIEPGVLTAQGCATRWIIASSLGVVRGRAQARAERRWPDAVREAGYNGQAFQNWRRARNVSATCRRDQRMWYCAIAGTPCNPFPDRINRPTEWQLH